jgi:hypothetical protein
MRTLIPYLQCVAITETKGSFDELVTFNSNWHDFPKHHIYYYYIYGFICTLL